jgi:acyl dehydratase
MTLDADVIGEAGPTQSVRVDAAKLKAFAEAIGETNPIYCDSIAARRAGHRDILVPPTYYFSLGLERERPLGFLEDRGVVLQRLLHGEQSFVYRRLAAAGEILSISRTVVDFHEKKAGELKIVVIETTIRDQREDVVATGRDTLVLPTTPPRPRAARVEPTTTGEATGGAALPRLRCGPITREMLARFGQASGDLNRVHLDPEVAIGMGYDDVFAHGMLSMAWVGRLLTNWTSQEAIRSFEVRFHYITPLLAEPVCEGWITADRRGHESAQNVDLRVLLGDGSVTLSGRAMIAAVDAPRP